jgi:hypothetical protein
MTLVKGGSKSKIKYIKKCFFGFYCFHVRTRREVRGFKGKRPSLSWQCHGSVEAPRANAVWPMLK